MSRKKLITKALSLLRDVEKKYAIEVTDPKLFKKISDFYDEAAEADILEDIPPDSRGTYRSLDFVDWGDDADY